MVCAGMDSISTRCGDCPRQPGASCLGHSHLGQRLLRARPSAVRSAGEGAVATGGGGAEHEVHGGHRAITF